MRTGLRTAVVICIGLLTVTGCQQRDRAISTTPSPAELPNFDKEFQSSLAIAVGVEGAGDVRGIRIVPFYEKIEPTPEERIILGEKPELEIDALVFYRPQRGPRHGVSTEALQRMTGVSGIGGAAVGLDVTASRYDAVGYAGRNFGVTLAKRPNVGVGLTRRRGGEAGQLWQPRVGECRARKPMEREKRN